MSFNPLGLIHIRDRNDLPHLIFVGFLVLGIILGVYLSLQPQLFNKQAAESSLVELAFVPDKVPVQSGRTYEVKVAVNPKSQRVTAMNLYIAYDPASVTILEAKNEGFLPITLKTEDDFKGTLDLVYGSTIQSQAATPGMVATIRFKALTDKPSQLIIKGNSQVSVSSQEENALTAFPMLNLEASSSAIQTGTEDTRYPDSLLLEKAFLPSSEPFVRDFQEASEPLPEIKPDRIKPELSGAYIKQLGKDIIIEPITALNQVIEDKATEIIKPK